MLIDLHLGDAIERGARLLGIEIAARGVHQVGACAQHVRRMALWAWGLVDGFELFDLLIGELELLAQTQHPGGRTAAARSTRLVILASTGLPGWATTTGTRLTVA